MKRTVVQLSDEHWRIIRSIVNVAPQSGQNMVPCKCPAGHDATLLLNYLPPAVYCFKERCKPDVDAINAALRDAFADAVEEGTLPEVLAERKRLPASVPAYCGPKVNDWAYSSLRPINWLGYDRSAPRKISFPLIVLNKRGRCLSCRKELHRSFCVTAVALDANTALTSASPFLCAMCCL
jgi:hypothetical protein